MISKTLRLSLFAFATAAFAYGCVSLKQNALYLDNGDHSKDSLFYASSEIYADILTSEGWVTQSADCIKAETTPEAAFKGSHGLDIQWNKTKTGCPWLGFGFGWDNWTGKDLSSIKNIAAIQFHVRMPQGERTGLPWAIGLEDFSGSQAWLGVVANTIKAPKIGSEWVRVEMPLSEFNWDEQQADASNIKQIIFNTEADGRIFIDEIKIVPYNGGFRKRASLETLQASQFTVDGNMNDDIWKEQALAFGNNEIHLALIDSFLCIAAKVKDKTPLENSFSGKDIYNGDAIELAFSTDPEAKRQRTNYLSTDQQIGFALSKKGIRSWDWREERELDYQDYEFALTKDGYVFEAKVRLSDLDASLFDQGVLYGLEVAVDHGNAKGRLRQERWNNPAVSKFHENPALWGEMYIVPPSQVLNPK